MEIRTAFFLGAVLLLFSNPFAFGQNQPDFALPSEETSSDGESGDEFEIEDDLTVESSWQELVWDELDSDSILRYDIVIEGFDEKNSEWTAVRTISTDGNETRLMIEPKLSAGKYRYKVVSYNLIGFPSAESGWNEFDIYKSFKPQIRSVSTAVNRSSTIYLEEYNDGILNVNGRNLFGTKDANPFNYTSYFLVGTTGKNRLVIVPELLENSSDNRKIKVHFDMDKIDVGTFNFVATDASGRSSVLNDDNRISVKFKKPVDIDVSGGYAVPMNLFDDTLPFYLDTKIWPESLRAKVSLLPFKRRWGYIGVGASAFYMRIRTEFDNYEIDGNLYAAHLNFTFQKPIFRKVGEYMRKHFMTVEARGGIGMTSFANVLFHFPHGIDSEPLNSSNLSFDVGAGVQVYLMGRLFLELDADFVVALVPDMSLGMLVPSVSVGWQF